jgi:hypothetical protein
MDLDWGMELVPLEGQAVWASRKGAVVLKKKYLAALDQRLEKSEEIRLGVGVGDDSTGGSSANATVVSGFRGVQTMVRSPQSSSQDLQSPNGLFQVEAVI